MKDQNKTIYESAKEAIEAQIPSLGAKKRRKQQEFIGGPTKTIKFRFCPKTYELIRWWCKSTRQFTGTFIQNAVIDAFIKEIGLRQDKIKLMEKYYNEYFHKESKDSEKLKATKEQEPDSAKIAKGAIKK